MITVRADGHREAIRREENIEGKMADSPVAVVVEDDADIRELITQILEQAGYQVFGAGDGIDGVRLVTEYSPQVTTLDVSLPGMDGLETARRIRAFSDTYIVMLTARADEIDTVQGLQAGADDYITKPFRPRELRARIEAMQRRPRGGMRPDSEAPKDDSAQWLEHKGLRLNSAVRQASVDDNELVFTRSEFDIVHELLSSGQRVIGKEDLALMLRGERYTGTGYVSEHDVRAIEVHMANIRRKLGESATRPRWIETVRGVGYRLTA
jgi:DNA-binding response OmpR family regulator